jgi:hypothetical protein
MGSYLERYYSSDFNSRIDYQDLTLRIHDYVLTLKLRIWLKQMNPPPGQATFQAYDAHGHAATAQQWGAAEWEDFRNEFRRQVYLGWNDAFVLIPPARYNGFVDPKGVRRNVRCFLEIDFRNEGGDGIHTIETYRIAPNGGNLRANAGLLSSTDIKPNDHYTDALKPIRYHKQPDGRMKITGGNPTGKTYYFQQHTFPHEVGHLLGLGHIANDSPACKKSGPNSNGCYGLYLADAMNIMGGGDALDIRNAEPWKKRIVKHAPPTQMMDWGVDFASGEARLRGLWSLKSA